MQWSEALQLLGACAGLPLQTDVQEVVLRSRMLRQTAEEAMRENHAIHRKHKQRKVKIQMLTIRVIAVEESFRL
jgi:hypothetical protein